MILRPELAGVAGVPEAMLSDALLAELPGNHAPAPWTCELSAVLWWHHGGEVARAALPAALREAHPALLVVGAMVRYSHTPVGAYDEVLGIVASRAGMRPFGHVAFMSVDSLASLVGGRANWAMPKTLGAFDGGVASRQSFHAVGADATTWSISATPRSFGPAFGMRSRAMMRQQFPGARIGAAAMSGSGRARLARVAVEVTSDGPLRTWLRPGRHLGMVLERASFTLAEPAFDDPATVG